MTSRNLRVLLVVVALLTAGLTAMPAASAHNQANINPTYDFESQCRSGYPCCYLGNTHYTEPAYSGSGNKEGVGNGWWAGLPWPLSPKCWSGYYAVDDRFVSFAGGWLQTPAGDSATVTSEYSDPYIAENSAHLPCFALFTCNSGYSYYH